MKIFFFTLIVSTSIFGQTSRENLVKFTNSDKLIGYKNKDSIVIVEPKYDNGSVFQNGLALVSTIPEGWTIIDNKGIELAKKGGVPGTVYEDLDYEYIRFSFNEKWGFIDRKGKEIIPFTYKETKDFNEGLAPVKVGRKWGFINSKNEMVIPPTYKDVGIFSDGLAAVKVKKLWGFINPSGQIVISPKYTSVHRFSEGLCSVTNEEFLFGFTEVISKEGKTIFSGRFFQMKLFKNGLSDYWEGYHFTGKHIFIDSTGKIVKTDDK